MKLVQKQFLKGIREFEIIDDMLFVRIKSLTKEQNSTVGLSTLDPEPIITGSELAFMSRYQSRPVLSLLLNNPDADTFNAFVDALKRNIRGQDDTIDMASPESTHTPQAEAPGWNVYHEPPEFGESDKPVPTIYTDRLEQDIAMLQTYLDENDIRPLINSLEALKADPQSAEAFQKMLDAYHGLGVHQGAVLTYAPYLKVLLSQTIWT